ncbi:unnamed protein product [Boreogadus saida]
MPQIGRIEGLYDYTRLFQQRWKTTTATTTPPFPSPGRLGADRYIPTGVTGDDRDLSPSRAKFEVVLLP